MAQFRKPRLMQSFDLSNGYYAYVASIDKPSPSLGGELATTLYYMDPLENVCGVVELYNENDEVWILGNHSINPEHRGKGLGRQLIPQLAKAIGRIESDAHHSPDAAKMWNAIPHAKKTPHGGYYVERLQEKVNILLGDPVR